MLALLNDIRRHQRHGALPWAGAQADQDAIFWESVDLVDALKLEVAERLKDSADG